MEASGEWGSLCETGKVLKWTIGQESGQTGQAVKRVQNKNRMFLSGETNGKTTGSGF
jgi:hypothetical protein